MSIAQTALWSPSEYCHSYTGLELGLSQQTIQSIYHQVCRTDHGLPGFCLISLGNQASTLSLRESMLDLLDGLRELHLKRNGDELVAVSAGRFDQKVATKLHRDGGPEQSLLMLGYEPSSLPSELFVADYSQLALELGMSPAEFLDRHNPMFHSGAELLLSHTTKVECFTHRQFQIVLINNSVSEYSPQLGNWQGLLHTAIIPEPRTMQERVVNSMMLARASAGNPIPHSVEELSEFAQTSAVRRRNYP